MAAYSTNPVLGTKPPKMTNPKTNYWTLINLPVVHRCQGSWNHHPNIYKPSKAKWAVDVLPTCPHPSECAWDFNIHNSLCRYAAEDTNDEALMLWSESSNLYLLFDARDRSPFHSARWNRDYNSNHALVSSSDDGSLPAFRSVLEDLPDRQHRPSILLAKRTLW